MSSASEETPATRRLGDFEIVREVGRGGMGVVYEARQASLNRKVALKVLSSAMGLSAKSVQRFRREAEAAAKLHHTNIVPIYATGDENGTYFYAMELIEGPSLDQVIRQLRQPPAEAPASPNGHENRDAIPLVSTAPFVENPNSAAPSSGLSASSLNSGGTYFDTVARLIAEVADALDYAHQQGVIHRDIKPSNLLLSPAGRLSVNDFGLARVLEQQGMTLTGEFVGTPAYMSPEQITAGRVPVDHRTDIYSLGATLYELLALRPPFSGASRDQLLAQITQKDPPRPRKLNPKVPVDLETICLKCLEKDPDRRYRTGGEVAEDLRRYVNRYAILAKRPGPLTKLTKWVARNPVLSGTALVMFLAVGVAFYFAWNAYGNHQRLLEQERRAAIDKGMVAAMATDLPMARAAITEAEALGASEGELQMLRGFVTLYSGDSATAIKECRAAAAALPKSVAARSLLAAAHGAAGDYVTADRIVKEAEQLPVRTPEDRLLLGLALLPFGVTDGLRELREAQRERPSKIGQVILADALWQHASHTGTVPDAEDALDAVETAVRLLPKNPYVETIAANARVAMAAAYDLADEPKKAALHLEAASRFADNISGSPESYAVVNARINVATYRDGLRPPLRLTRRLGFPTTIKEPEIAGLEALTLWRLGEIEKARTRLAPLKMNYFTGPLKVGLALEQADGGEAARNAWKSAITPESHGIMMLTMIPYLYLTGEPDQVKEHAKQLRASGKRWARNEVGIAEWELTMNFFEEKLNDSDFLKAPTAERSFKPYRHLTVGMKRLGEGDRDAAKAAFTEAFNFRCFWHDEWMWACTFLVRMNTDPEWPRAIPMKKKS